MKTVHVVNDVQISEGQRYLHFLRSLPQQGYALRRGPALDSGNLLQRQQPLFPVPHSW